MFATMRSLVIVEIERNVVTFIPKMSVQRKFVRYQSAGKDILKPVSSSNQEAASMVMLANIAIRMMLANVAMRRK